ncbi:MAG: alpha-2-macroglobulin, partial [Planctomycetaceae bacterium]|nr:alpha-2-macroglobulin [Planctomycetaceae bacterium]
PDHWRLLVEAARQYTQIQHFGFLIAGKFERGHHRGGGNVANAAARDRVRALRLIAQAAQQLPADLSPGERARFYLEWADIWKNSTQAWELQVLTDLEHFPDYEEGWGRGGERLGAPVHADGTPVYYEVPETYAAAKNDGQRWRWCLTEAGRIDPRSASAADLRLADFLRSQFGVQTIREFGIVLPRTDVEVAGGKPADEKTGPFALETLGEDETIARLATGIARFKLPEEFNYIRIYQRVAERREADSGVTALIQLASEFENRRQYPRAAEYFRTAIALAAGDQKKFLQQQLDQIVGNFGRFETANTQPAGRGASVEFVFRNGKQVKFTAQEIRVAQLLNDVKAYLRGNPQQLDWQRLNITELGYRLLEENQQKYLGQQVANWQLDLAPRPNHLDRRITIASPLQKPGAYWVTAKMADGNTSHIVFWVADTVLAQKPIEGGAYYLVADAVTGAPIPKANVEYFGYRVEHQAGKRPRIETKNFAEFTDTNGQALIKWEPKLGKEAYNYQWFAVARTEAGRLAYLGFNHVWSGARDDSVYDVTKALAITDRPVYRPQDKVEFKIWVAQSKYDQPDKSPFAGKDFVVEIQDPRGEKALEKHFTADEYGGLTGEFPLDSAAKLGVYQIFVQGIGGGSFRVEEYKKPEFEVSIAAPDKPIQLGDKFTATIKAEYYFGAPVTDAKVKYKVLRSPHVERWYPIMPWDWLYGRGYAWLGVNYDWYPGWNRWGCLRPIPPWWGFHPGPPEVVSENEVEIGSDGTAKIEIDSAIAKELHGDQDHKYEITAEVTDRSRRTIVGTGRVMAARRPFQVTTWVGRGYYRVGDKIEAHAAAKTLDGQGVAGQGEFELFRVTYDAQRQPREQSVEKWSVATDADGMASQEIQAAQAGQYRLVYRLPDSQGQTIEGAYVFTIIGQGFDGSGFRFAHLEVTPDKNEYRPGDTARLLINADHVGSTVYLFVRPVNGVYAPPQVLRLKGKSTVAEIAIAQGDMPNIFVEA